MADELQNQVATLNENEESLASGSALNRYEDLFKIAGTDTPETVLANSFEGLKDYEDRLEELQKKHGVTDNAALAEEFTEFARASAIHAEAVRLAQIEIQKNAKKQRGSIRGKLGSILSFERKEFAEEYAKKIKDVEKDTAFIAGIENNLESEVRDVQVVNAVSVEALKKAGSGIEWVFDKNMWGKNEQETCLGDGANKMLDGNADQIKRYLILSRLLRPDQRDILKTGDLDSEKHREILMLLYYLREDSFVKQFFDGISLMGVAPGDFDGGKLKDEKLKKADGTASFLLSKKDEVSGDPELAKKIRGAKDKKDRAEKEFSEEEAKFKKAEDDYDTAEVEVADIQGELDVIEAELLEIDELKNIQIDGVGSLAHQLWESRIAKADGVPDLDGMTSAMRDAYTNLYNDVSKKVGGMIPDAEIAKLDQVIARQLKAERVNVGKKEKPDKAKAKREEEVKLAAAKRKSEKAKLEMDELNGKLKELKKTQKDADAESKSTQQEVEAWQKANPERMKYSGLDARELLVVGITKEFEEKGIQKKVAERAANLNLNMVDSALRDQDAALRRVEEMESAEQVESGAKKDAKWEGKYLKWLAPSVLLAGGISKETHERNLIGPTIIEKLNEKFGLKLSKKISLTSNYRDLKDLTDDQLTTLHGITKKAIEDGKLKPIDVTNFSRLARDSRRWLAQRNGVEKAESMIADASDANTQAYEEIVAGTKAKEKEEGKEGSIFSKLAFWRKKKKEGEAEHAKEGEHGEHKERPKIFWKRLWHDANPKVFLSDARGIVGHAIDNNLKPSAKGHGGDH